MVSTHDLYDDQARARLVTEPPKSPLRTPFERDRARLVHSAALRRLAAKTQVVGPQTDDFVRNRLTHTLEVAQVARDLARMLGCDPDVAEAAALAHDLGHPPFGHNGERALAELMADHGGFEGNAQTLRILTRLETKTLDAGGRSVGLNLTRATLDAATKYPWGLPDAPRPAGVFAEGTLQVQRKFGVYEDDRPVFAWVREGARHRRPCLEAQVMDLADDIAYSVHDLEDGIVAGPIDPPALRDAETREMVWSTVREWYLPDAGDQALERALGQLVARPGWPLVSFDGSRRASAGLKGLTSDLIGLFCREATAETRASYGDRPLVRHHADLVIPHDTSLMIAVLKGIAAHFVMRAEDRLPVLERQREVLTNLVAALRERPDALESALQEDFAEAPGDAARLRVVVDQVASLTDASALTWHARLCG